MVFCTRCGKQIKEGEICSCSQNTQSDTIKTQGSDFLENMANQKASQTYLCPKCGNQVAAGYICGCSNNSLSKFDKDKAKEFIKSTKDSISKIDKDKAMGFIESTKNRMGIGSPERNATDAYERGMLIVPDCIEPNENEIPIKQYNIAILRNLLRFERAEGRLQITNKRVVFRAAGTSVGGRTTLQQEFAIDELSGIEARYNYRFGLIYLIIGILVVSLMALIFSSIDGFFVNIHYENINNKIQKVEEQYYSDLQRIEQQYSNDWNKMEEQDQKINKKYQEDFRKLQEKRDSNFSFFTVVKFFIGLAGLATFFLMYEKWLLKLAILGLSGSALMSIFMSIGDTNVFMVLPLLPLLIIFVCVVVSLGIYSLKPNLVLIIMTKGGFEGAAPIKIKRSGMNFWTLRQDDAGTGFSEVFPTDESDGTIREINAIINDIKTLGDLGVEKWVK